MMKKILLTLLAFMATVAMNAEQVSKQQALQKAQQFMPNKHFGEVKAFARGDKSASLAEYEAFYIFNAEGKKGFVIVSGDDRTEPILGYSDRGSLNVDSVPDNVKGLLNYYEKVLTAIANDKSYTRPAKTRGGERAKVETLMATEWGQGFPYNIKCPVINGQRTVTGCVATALAQVLNYNRWPKDYTSAVPAYTTWSEQIFMPQLEPIKFGWGTMDMQFLGNLMLYCGQALEMNYGVFESAADVSIIPDVLKTIFGYTGEPKFFSSENFTDEEWDNMMYAEMVGKRPVIFSGFGEQMTGYSGHSFVIDGYESGHYHVNWGWDGDCNGMFLLTGLYVSGGSYNEHQSAVIGIQSPEGNAGIFMPKAQMNYIYHDNQKYYWRQSDGKFPVIEISAVIFGTTEEKETLQLGWGLYNANGLVKVYAQEIQEIGLEESLFNVASIIIDNDIADGEYCILPVSRSNDLEEWTADIPNIMGSGFSPGYYTGIYIHNNLLKLFYPYLYYSTKGLDIENDGYIINDDGVAYDLWQELGKKYATVIPSPSGSYNGDINIPDIISHNSKDYEVYNADITAFENCPELTSLSTSMYEGPRIDNCPKLANLELREGVSVYYDNYISNCHALSSLELPASLSLCKRTILSNCEKLESIKFKSTKQMVFSQIPIWENLPALSDVYFLSNYPPARTWSDSYTAVDENVTLHIPQGTLSVYRSSVWKDWNLSDDQSAAITNQVGWSYIIDNNSEHYTTTKVGSINRCNVDFGIHIPADMLEKYKDYKITGIEYYTEDPSFYEVPDYVFITKPGTDYLLKQSVQSGTQFWGWNKILLSEPYIITGDELFVGIGRSVYLDFFHSDSDMVEDDGIWERIMDEKKIWYNQKHEHYGHPLTIRFTIEGENLPKDLRLCQVRLEDEKASSKVLLSVVNRCPDILTSYTVKWDIDGKINGTKTIETSLASSMAETLSIDIPSEITGYYHTLTLDVVSVNGVDDEIPANSHIVYEYKTSGKQYPRTMVLEDFIDTTCGWSPRGYETAKNLYEKYPDNFVSIAVSVIDWDELEEPINYNEYVKTYTTTPTFLINRVKTINSELKDATAALEEQKDHADAMINANAIFTTADCTSVTVKTATTFGFSEDGNADFRIAYVVIEDNVGPIMQYNFYSDPTNPDDPNDYMNEWYKKGSPVEMRLNDVARGIYPDLNGTEGSVPTSVVAGQPYEYEYTFDLPDNIQDKKNIRIVTLLIDNKSGEIMNADQTKVFTETDKDGDANNDNEVDDKDIEAVVRYIMYGDINGFNIKNADVNGDNKINAKDIVTLVNMIKKM